MSVDFIDTNVLAYLFDRQDHRRRGIATALVEQALAEGTAVISWQVAQEVINAVTRKAHLELDAGEIRNVVRDLLQPLWRVQPSPELLERALDIKTKHGFGWYDSLIVAAALEAGCMRLLSEDLQHGQRFGRLRIENPFRS